MKIASFLVCLTLTIHCGNTPHQTTDSDQDSLSINPEFSDDKDVRSLITLSIVDGAFPGAVVSIGKKDHAFLLRGYGHFTYDKETTVGPQTKYDLASLTKVIATTSAVMKLYEEGKLDLEAKVADYLPDFGNNGKENITVRHLMTHTGGLKPFYPFYNMGITTRDDLLDYIFKDKTYYSPGSDMQYSDLDMILMALIVEKISGQGLEEYLRENFWNPMGMQNTEFRPSGGAGTSPEIAPTENDTYFRHQIVQGEVHDETAWILGGTAGHAGLFSTAEDLTKFAQMMACYGEFEGRRYLKEETIRMFTTAVDPDNHTRALGWDTKSPSGYSSAGSFFGPHSFGHTGFTGTSIWIDPDNGLYVILLTNRVYPTRENRKISAVRPDLADIAYQNYASKSVTDKE